MKTEHTGVFLLASLAISGLGAEPVPGGAGGGGSPFSGKLTACFYAIDTATFVKAPDALLANSSKLADFFDRASKEGKAYEILRSDVTLAAGTGSLSKDSKDFIHDTEFEWQGDNVAPVRGKQWGLKSGINLQFNAAIQESAVMRSGYGFSWVPEITLREIPGASRKIGFMQRQRIGVEAGLAVLHKGETILAGEWRSDVVPPGAKTTSTKKTEPGSIPGLSPVPAQGGHWVYLLFFRMP
ncbi:MAG: hypothetical protein ABI600_11620 [Luteolibacter sp.]